MLLLNYYVYLLIMIVDMLIYQDLMSLLILKYYNQLESYDIQLLVPKDNN
jgi:hypothetical protein